MISKSRDIREFIEAVKDKAYLDIISLAEKEATEAERFFYRTRSLQDNASLESKKYADLLKDFISYMRYTNKPTDIRDENIRLFRILSESFQRVGAGVRT
jgi:hypothetical protein